MSEQFSFEIEGPRSIEELKKAYHEHIGVPYYDAGESEELTRGWIELILKMPKEDAKAAVRHREQQESQDLTWYQK